MKYKACEQITTFHIAKDLEEGDYFTISLPNKRILTLKYNIATRTLNLSLTSEGGLIDKEPFLQITDAQMEDLDASPSKGTYHSVGFPSELLPQVKERLKGLPIIF